MLATRLKLWLSMHIYERLTVVACTVEVPSSRICSARSDVDTMLEYKLVVGTTQRTLTIILYGADGRTIEVVLMLMTANSSKRQWRVNEHEYFSAQAYNLTNSSLKDHNLLNDPWAWWLQVG